MSASVKSNDEVELPELSDDNNPDTGPDVIESQISEIPDLKSDTKNECIIQGCGEALLDLSDALQKHGELKKFDTPPNDSELLDCQVIHVAQAGPEEEAIDLNEPLGMKEPLQVLDVLSKHDNRNASEEVEVQFLADALITFGKQLQALQQRLVRQENSRQDDAARLVASLDHLENLCRDTAAMSMQDAQTVLGIGLRIEVLEESVSRLLDDKTPKRAGCSIDLSARERSMASASTSPGLSESIKCATTPGSVSIKVATSDDMAVGNSASATTLGFSDAAESNVNVHGELQRHSAEIALKALSKVTLVETRMMMLEQRVSAEVRRALRDLGYEHTSQEEPQGTTPPASRDITNKLDESVTRVTQIIRPPISSSFFNTGPIMTGSVALEPGIRHSSSVSVPQSFIRPPVTSSMFATAPVPSEPQMAKSSSISVLPPQPQQTAPMNVLPTQQTASINALPPEQTASITVVTSPVVTVERQASPVRTVERQTSPMMVKRQTSAVVTVERQTSQRQTSPVVTVERQTSPVMVERQTSPLVSSPVVSSPVVLSPVGSPPQSLTVQPGSSSHRSPPQSLTVQPGSSSTAPAGPVRLQSGPSSAAPAAPVRLQSGPIRLQTQPSLKSSIRHLAPQESSQSTNWTALQTPQLLSQYEGLEQMRQLGELLQNARAGVKVISVGAQTTPDAQEVGVAQFEGMVQHGSSPLPARTAMPPRQVSHASQARHVQRIRNASHSPGTSTRQSSSQSRSMLQNSPTSAARPSSSSPARALASSSLSPSRQACSPSRSAQEVPQKSTVSGATPRVSSPFVTPGARSRSDTSRQGAAPGNQVKRIPSGSDRPHSAAGERPRVIPFASIRQNQSKPCSAPVSPAPGFRHAEGNHMAVFNARKMTKQTSSPALSPGKAVGGWPHAAQKVRSPSTGAIDAKLIAI